MFLSENRLEISLRSVKLKLDEWPEALEFNLDEKNIVIMTGINGGGKTLTMKLIMDYCELINSYSRSKGKNFRELLGACGVEYFSLKFGYDWFKYDQKLSNSKEYERKKNGGSKIPWIRPVQKYVNNELSHHIMWEYVSRTTSIDLENIEKDSSKYDAEGTIFHEHIISANKQNSPFNDYTMRKIESVVLDCEISIIHDLTTSKFQFQCLEENELEESILHRSLAGGVEVETYGPPDFIWGISKQSGIDFESFGDERYGKSRNWMNPNIHPQFVFNPPVYLNVEDAYKLIDSNLETLESEIYEYGVSRATVDETIILWLFEKYEGRRRWFEENTDYEDLNEIQDEYDCACDNGECEIYPEGFYLADKEEYLSYNAFLTLFDYSLNLIDMDCEILRKLVYYNWNDEGIKICIEEETSDWLDDWGGAGGKNNPDNKYTFNEDLFEYLPEELSDFDNDFATWWAIKDIIPNIPIIPSSGQKRIIGIFSELCSLPNQSSVVFIDEPEISLHIDWQEEFVDILSRAFPKMKFILATHAPNLISNHFDLVLQVPPSDLI